MVQKSLKLKIVIICGPTASGKSNFAVDYAEKLGGEIIGADSVQIYRHLNIGSGKITANEMRGITHHMINILEPHEEYSVSDYVKSTRGIIVDVISRGKMPIIVGGTGLYIKSLLEGHNFANAPKNEAIREQYKKILNEKGKEFIYDKLKSIDPESTEKISINDTKRIIRALEIFEITGIPKSRAAESIKSCDYDYKMLVLYKERELLYQNIGKRVDKMFDLGLLDEVKSLLEYRDCQSMQSIGYKETLEYLSNNGNLDDTKELIKFNTRHYAKRQMTFFRGMKCDKEWINV